MYFCGACRRRPRSKKGIKTIRGTQLCKKCFKLLMKSGLPLELFISRRRENVRIGIEKQEICPKCHVPGSKPDFKGRYMRCGNCRSTWRTESQKNRNKEESALTKLKIKKYAEMQRREAELNLKRRAFKDRQAGIVR